jgi:hypothetical protein
MTQLINEARRFQQLANIKEISDPKADDIALAYSNTSPNTPPGSTPGSAPSKMNEAQDLNAFGKILFDRLTKNGFSPKFVTKSMDFDKLSQETRKKDSKLVVVQYDDMGTPGDGFIMVGGNNDNHDEIGKILDSIKSELPAGARHFSNNMWSWQITGSGMNKESLDIDSVVNEALESFRKENK